MSNISDDKVFQLSHLQADTGYHYFIWFTACLIGAFSVFFGWEFTLTVPNFERKSPKKLCCQRLEQIFILVLFSLCLCVITWTACIPGTDWMYAAICAILIGMIVLLMYNRWRGASIKHDKHTKRAFMLGLVTYCLLVPALVILTSDHHIYTMEARFKPTKMNVTDVEVAFDSNFQCQDDYGRVIQGCNGYRAKLQVNWDATVGYCNTETNLCRNCTAWLIDSACQIITEESWTTIAHMTEVVPQIESCMKDLYGDDLRNFTMEALGTCSAPSSAKPLDPERFDYTIRIKTTGLAVGLTGILIFFWVYLKVLYQDRHQFKKQFVEEFGRWGKCCRRGQINSESVENTRDGSRLGDLMDTMRSAVMAHAQVIFDDDSSYGVDFELSDQSSFEEDSSMDDDGDDGGDSDSDDQSLDLVDSDTLEVLENDTRKSADDSSGGFSDTTDDKFDNYSSSGSLETSLRIEIESDSLEDDGSSRENGEDALMENETISLGHGDGAVEYANMSIEEDTSSEKSDIEEGHA